MLTRRTFLKGSLVAGGAFVVLGGRTFRGDRVWAAIPGGSLDPAAVSKYATPLLIPPAMPRAGKINLKGGKQIDYYEIAMRQFRQQILPVGHPMTTVWGYGPKAARGGPLIFNAPSLTIEAKYRTPVRVKWVNELVDANGNYLPHLLPVDPTLHWANPPGGTEGRDMRPEFTSTPGAYTGPVPMVTHVHGAAGVGDESDGYAEAWYLPAAGNIPSGHAAVGTWYDFFKAKASTKFGVNWSPGSATFQYPNDHRAATIWYHDHTLGMTRLNVYAGPAGFYIVRGGPGDEVFDTRTGSKAVLPRPAPSIGDPPGMTYYEIPIAIQDRSFNADGSLFYPDTRAFFEDVDPAGPFIPDSDISPIWNPEFFGNFMMVNGNTWPFQVVEQRRYRLRFLDGCDSRFLILDFSNIPGVEVWQIGNEGGYLPTPVNLTAVNGNRLLMGPAERADCIVDFTNVPLGDYVLGNIGPDEPFGGGVPGVDFAAADPETTGQVMSFRVVAASSPDPTTPPEFLRLPPITPLTGGTTRKLALLEQMSENLDEAPAETRLGTVDADGAWTSLKWEDEVTENPAIGATEVWEFYNATADAHPIHVHETFFQVVDRQDIKVVEGEVGPEEEPGTVTVVEGSTREPQPGETGFKDTVIAYPEQVTRVRLRFDNAGQFVWHCHIVEHEDNEMMRPYRIGPAQPGQPGTMPMP